MGVGNRRAHGFVAPRRLAALALGGTAWLCAAACGPTGSGDPAAVEVHVEDVVRFWAAADPLLDAVEAGDVPDSLVAQTAQRLQREYLDAGSGALTRFASRRALSGQSLARAIASDPFRYRTIRRSSMEVVARRDSVRARVVAVNQRLADLYRRAAFRDVYFVVGDGRSGGTFFTRSTVVAAEMAGTLDDYISLVAHELAHVQQPQRSNTTVLRRALREGAADWVAEQITGMPVRSASFAWGYAHEAEVWDDFRRDAGSAGHARWFGDEGYVISPGRLGYFMGYRIISDYARTLRVQGESESHIMTEILAYKDHARVMDESGYQVGPVSRIRDGALRAMGWDPTQVPGSSLPAQGVEALAEVAAPDGSIFGNRVVSNVTGAGLVEQSDGYRAAAGRRFTRATGADGTDLLNDETRGFVRGHELHALALFPETRMFEPAYLGTVEVPLGPAGQAHTSEAHAVRWKINATDSLVLYYSARDSLPLGADILWMESAVQVRFTDWDSAGSPRLFRGAVFTQGEETFRYRYTDVRLELQPGDEYLRTTPTPQH